MNISPEDNYLNCYIRYIKRRLERVLDLVDFEKDGKSIPITGFRLKNIKNWAFSDNNTMLENFGSLSGVCDLNCKFCYEKGNPLAFEQTILSMEEALTRKKYYSLKDKKGIIVTKQRKYMEPFTNPKIFEILSMLRNYSAEEMIILTTNGHWLTFENVKKLASLKPILLVVSLNSANINIRKNLMNDRRAAISINSLVILKEFGIPFVSSVVPWPTTPEDDLVNTLNYIDNCEARAIRVTLPGYSKYFSAAPLFDTKSYWEQLIETLLKLRRDIIAPLIIMPSLYWNTPMIPQVDGIIKNSPAASQGLRVGDRVIKIDNVQIFTKGQARKALGDPQITKPRELEVTRDGSSFKITLIEQGKISDNYYPYKPVGYDILSFRQGNERAPYGIFFYDDFNISWINRLINIIDKYQANRILVLTSEIIKPIVQAFIESIPSFKQFFKERELYLHIPEHDFWGGNIIIGDLYLTADYIKAAQLFISNNKVRPDLIIIPSSYANESGFDLTGESFVEIERATGIPTELVECEIIKF